MMNPTAISEKGIALIKKHEGLRLTAYDDLRPLYRLSEGDDAAGTVTIGYGHTKTARPGQTITEDEAERLLRGDLEAFVSGVRALAREHNVTLKQHEFDALVSFSFNVGLKALEDSTLWSHIYAGRRFEAAGEFLRWRFSKGRELKGLFKRRVDEMRLFIGLED